MDQLAEELFTQAWEMESGERGRFLDAACAGNEGLRRVVEQFLLDAELAETYFARPAAEAGALSGGQGLMRGESEGDWIGPYKLLQKIGEGGFGVVWMAEQSKPIARRVAIKVIKAGMDTKEVLARFDAERQALARMEHPHIARVLDAGATPAGRSYFAMELVKGIPITSFCDEQKLDTDGRLALFLDVCSAVNHAHQKGVIHRDIKPSNVLVTLSGDKPMVKVIDFGIAKATEGKLTDGTLFTRIEQMVGTPMYMSPEQAGLGSLDIDTRSDIYSLGVLLYELLAGVPPFEQKTLVESGYAEMRRIIREVEPPRPSVRLTSLRDDQASGIADARRVSRERLGKMIATDLDWIVMRAIDKSRDRRYETADALALDIRRYLGDEPVDARPPGQLYVLGKIARRYRSALGALVGLVCVLILATGFSLWQTRRATRAEREVAERRGEIIAERMAKESAMRDAETGSSFLMNLLRRPTPENGGKDITVVEALDAAAAEMEARPASQPASQSKQKEILARTYMGLGEPEKSLALWSHVVESRMLHDGEGSSVYQAARREYLAAKDMASASPQVTKGDVMESGASGGSRGGTKRDSDADNLRIRILYLLIRRHTEAGEITVASKLYEELFKLHDEIYGRTHKTTLECMSKMLDRAPIHEQYLTTAIELNKRRTEVFGPDNLDVLKAQSMLIIQLRWRQRWEESLELGLDVVPRLRKVYGLQHVDTFMGTINLARCLLTDGQTQKGIDLLMECKPQMGNDTYIYMHLASLLVWFGRMDEYKQIRRQCLQSAADYGGGFMCRRFIFVSCIAPLDDDGQIQHIRTLLEACDKTRFDESENGYGRDPATLRMISGLFSYRAGDFDMAIRQMDESLAMPGGMPFEANYVKAMAMHKTGRFHEAKELFVKTSRELQVWWASDEHPLKGNGCDSGEATVCWLLYKEARALLGMPDQRPDVKGGTTHE